MPTEDFQKRIEQTTENIETSDVISEANKELLRDYKRDQMLNGLSEATLLKNLSRLKVLSENSDKPFNEMDKSDVKDLLEWVHSQDYTDETIDTYKTVMRGFWTWLNDGETPEEIDWIKLSNSNGNDTLPKDLLSKEDIEAQVEAAKNPRDRAFIYTLYETGARIGELIDLTVGDIEDRKHGKKVVIDGKTGSRRLPLVESVPYINQWLNEHPNPEKEAPLWCKIQQGGPDDKLGYRYIREKVLKKNMDRADIDKPSNPHHYRHSRASELATEMTEAQLCEWFGWVQGSDVPQRYVHLSGRDIDNTYDQMHGLYEPDEKEQQPDVIECPRCEELNQPEATFCMRCGFGLDQERADEFEAETDEDIKQDYQDIEPGADLADKLETLDSLMDDPDIKSFLEQKQ
ncbi:tyrosine-type recombinase/integrase [Halovenus rubra]|uniref:Tyrosine-type recombinase/integrase n=2 Tax=Halovenus rubra TaxID=869890 RepID=A0ACC7DW94_9EURY|nr:tyrosine-type recombinase/integrase [Halovenus rubra]